MYQFPSDKLLIKETDGGNAPGADSFLSCEIVSTGWIQDILITSNKIDP